MAYKIPLGIFAGEHEISPNSSIEYLYDSQNTMLNMTIRLDNANEYPTNDDITITIIDYGRDFTTQYTLTSFRYGVYIDEIRINKIVIKNNSNIATAEVYLETMTKPVSEYPNEVAQFITQINTSQPPNNQSLYQGSNNRYTGTLADATFLESTPIGTPMAIRQINAQSTSDSAVGFITIQFAQNFTFNANIEPLGVVNYTSTLAFNTDSITNKLPSSVTQTNAEITYVMIDYYFDYTMQITFNGNYSITSSGTTTTIQFNGTVFAYFYTNTSLPLTNSKISSITSSDSTYSVNPTSGTTNSSGNLSFGLNKELTSTTTFPTTTITASADISGVSKTTSITSTPTSFNFVVNGEYTNQGLSTTTISSNETLSSDLIIQGNLTIDSGVTVTTNGYSIICEGNFTNNGTIVSGLNTLSTTNSSAGYGSYGIFVQCLNFTNNGTINTNAGNGSQCNGNGGGGGGAGAIVVAYYGTYTNNGTITQNGGGGGSSSGTSWSTNSGSPGGSTHGGTPSLSNTTLSSWYTNGIQQYLEGAGGGGSGGCNGDGVSYSDSYGAGGGSGGTGGAFSGTNGNPGGKGSVFPYKWTSNPPINKWNSSNIGGIIQSTTSIPIPNQSVSLKITGTGDASFSSTSIVTTATATTSSNGGYALTIYNNNGTNTLTATSTIATITHTSSITI